MGKTIYTLHAEMCRVFTSPVRLEILDILRDGKRSVSDLVEHTGLSQSNVSHHLKIMRDKEIVNTEKKGNFVFYSVADPKITEAFDIIKEILLDKIERTQDLYDTLTSRE